MRISRIKSHKRKRNYFSIKFELKGLTVTVFGHGDRFWYEGPLPLSPSHREMFTLSRVDIIGWLGGGDALSTDPRLTPSGRLVRK